MVQFGKTLNDGKLQIIIANMIVVHILLQTISSNFFSYLYTVQLSKVTGAVMQSPTWN